MSKTASRFIAALAAGSFLTSGGQLLFAQRHAPQPNTKLQTNFPHDSIVDQYGAPTDPKVAKAAMLRQNAQEFQESVERLSVLVNELKVEVEKAATTDVLSVKTYKKAQEIEKLAKQIKNKAKG
jgi:hypothetical protein